MPGALIPFVALGRAMPARAGWLMVALIAGFMTPVGEPAPGRPVVGGTRLRRTHGAVHRRGDPLRHGWGEGDGSHQVNINVPVVRAADESAELGV